MTARTAFFLSVSHVDCDDHSLCCMLKDDFISQFTFDDFLVFYHKLCGRPEVHSVFKHMYDTSHLSVSFV